MPERAETARSHAADLRDVLADARDLAADARDQVAGERDTVADTRDGQADLREQQLDQWEAQLEARARRLGLSLDADRGTADRSDAAAARAVAAADRADRAGERTAAGRRRDEAAWRRLAQRRGTVLAATFARIAEDLHASRTPDELLTRIVEAALTTITGATGATVTAPGPGPDRSGAAAGDAAVLSFPVGGGSLEVFATDPGVLDGAARELGFILAAHASLAARAVGERLRLEGVGRQLEQALASRDVIGQAKGILMERLRVTPEEAFDILRRSSQDLNVKLREVARSLAETGTLPPTDGARGERLA